MAHYLDISTSFGSTLVGPLYMSLLSRHNAFPLYNIVFPIYIMGLIGYHTLKLLEFVVIDTHEHYVLIDIVPDEKRHFLWLG